MAPVTLPAFLDRGVKCFMALSKSDPIIKKMQDALGDKTFGGPINFVYEAGEFSCIIPTIKETTLRKEFRHSCLLTVKDPQLDQIQDIFLSTVCSICLEDGEDGEDVSPITQMFDQCLHARVCDDCIALLVNQVAGDCFNCPSCRAEVQSMTPLKEVLAIKPLLEFPEQIDFSLKEVNEHEWLPSVYDNNNFISPLSPVSDNLRRRLQLPDNIQWVGFIYPITGKSLDLTCRMLQPTDDMSPEQRALYEVGGFAFYDADGNVQSIHSLVDPNVPDAVSIPFQKRRQTTDQQRGAMDQAIRDLKNIDANRYNVCRITLGFSFLMLSILLFKTEHSFTGLLTANI